MTARYRSAAAPGEALTHPLPPPRAPPRPTDTIAEVLTLLGAKDDWQRRRDGLARLRQLAASEPGPWLAAGAERCLAPLLAMLHELRSALLGDVCATISALVVALADEPTFNKILPKLFEGALLTPTRDKMMFVAGNGTLRTVIACSTHSRAPPPPVPAPLHAPAPSPRRLAARARACVHGCVGVNPRRLPWLRVILALPPAAVVELMGRIEEACTNRHNYRMRARGFDCTLQMLLTWPERKLGRHRLNLARVLHAGCSDANAHVRACARRGTMAMALRLPVHGGRLRGELDRATDALVGEEEAWVQRQLTEGCSFGVGDGSAPESHEVISAPVPGPDPERQDFTIGAGPGEETRVRTPRTGFEMRQIVKSLSTEIRSVLASAAYTIEEAFREFDADGNGTLDPGELRQGWATVAAPPRLSVDTRRFDWDFPT
eukprot:COSAG01_NODE_66_length_29241_cov_17.772768_15_plen_433_part_00